MPKFICILKTTEFSPVFSVVAFWLGNSILLQCTRFLPKLLQNRYFSTSQSLTSLRTLLCLQQPYRSWFLGTFYLLSVLTLDNSHASTFPISRSPILLFSSITGKTEVPKQRKGKNDNGLSSNCLWCAQVSGMNCPNTAERSLVLFRDPRRKQSKTKQTNPHLPVHYWLMNSPEIRQPGKQVWYFVVRENCFEEESLVLLTALAKKHVISAGCLGNCRRWLPILEMVNMEVGCLYVY